MSKRERTQSEIVEAAIRASGAEEIEMPPDVYAGDDPEKEGEREEASTQAADRTLNDTGADRLRQLEEENAKLREENNKYERLHKKWVLGDYSGFEPSDPFEVLVYTDDSPWAEHVLRPSLNGRKYPIPRGVPTRVPFAIVKLLDEAKVDGPQRRVGLDGHPYDVHEQTHRFPFSAHPVHGGEPMPLPIITARREAA